MKEAVNRWLDMTTKQVQKDFQEKFQKDVVAEVTDWKGKKIVRPAVLQVMKDAGDTAYKILEIKGSFDVLNVKAVEKAEKITAELVRQVNNETKKGIRAFIAGGIKEGKSMPKIARELRPIVGLTERQTNAVLNYRALLSDKEKFPQLTADDIDRRVNKYARKLHRKRTETIARTETARAQIRKEATSQTHRNHC